MRSLSRIFFANRTAAGVATASSVSVVAAVAALTALVCAAAAPAARAQEIITQWNFNSTPSDNTASTGTRDASTGTGTAVAVGGPNGAFGTSNNFGLSDPDPTNNDSSWTIIAFPAQGTNNETRGLQFNSSVAGYQNIQVSFDVSVGLLASRYWRLQYTTNGTDFTNFTATAANTTVAPTDSGLLNFAGAAGNGSTSHLNQVTVDLSLIPFAASPELFGFRLVSAFAPGTSGYAVAGSGTYNVGGALRVDMVTVSGTEIPAATVVPEPGTFALAGMGALALAGTVVRRRKVSAAAS